MNYDLAANENVRLDDLLVSGLKIFQHKQQFCFSMDAVLLAHFAFLPAQARCADLGTGTGVIAMLLAARGAAKVDALELNPVMAELAARSVAYNHLTEKVTVHEGDLRAVKTIFPSGALHVVVANPPYRPLEHGELSKLDDVAKARHEITANLHDVVQAAKYLLKYRGRFAMVHLPERLAEIITEMREAGIEPKRMQLVHPHSDKPPNMLLIEGIVGGKPGMEILEPLIVYQADGSYTKEIARYYVK